MSIIRSIEGVIAASGGLDEITVDPDGLVPETFWRSNEVRVGQLAMGWDGVRQRKMM